LGRSGRLQAAPDEEAVVTRARISLVLTAVLVGGALGFAWARQHPTYVSRAVIEFISPQTLDADKVADVPAIESSVSALTQAISSRPKLERIVNDFQRDRAELQEGILLADMRKARVELPRTVALEGDLLEDRYRVLWQKTEDARTAGGAERRQTGPRVAVVEGARVPEVPVNSAARAAAFGSLAGGGIGLALVPFVRRRRAAVPDRLTVGAV
jgi:hypothetical protein